MKNLVVKLVVVSGVLALAGLIYAQGAEQPAAAKKAAAPAKYIGAQKCKNCHSAEAVGNQHGLWMKSKHAQAFELLGTDEAKKVGAAKGVAEPQTSDQCLKCHTTAFGEAKERFGKGFDIKLGVQCETCHGPGEAHMKARMAAAAADTGAEGAEKPYVSPDPSEIIANPTVETCKACHNKDSPTAKPFCFHKRSAEIRHLNPRHPRTEADWAKILVCNCGEKCACEAGEEGKCGVPSKDGKAPK